MPSVLFLQACCNVLHLASIVHAFCLVTSVVVAAVFCGVGFFVTATLLEA